ncbi:MAG TPA: peptidase M20, partial [Brevundimonas sp.]|nr:peptidase M20 [Brevundimonas sp.]
YQLPIFVAAALAALVDLGLTRPLGLLPPAVATVLGGAWLLGIGHFVFLGVGMDLPGALAVVGLLVLLFARPLAPETRTAHLMLFAAAACLIAGVGLNLSAQLLAPSPAVAEALP